MIINSPSNLKSLLFQIAAWQGEGLYFGARTKATVRVDFNKLIKMQC